MYYILIAIFLIIVYFALTKILSSLFKGCLVTLGIFALVAAGYIMIRSSQKPITLFNTFEVDNFQIRRL